MKRNSVFVILLFFLPFSCFGQAGDVLPPRAGMAFPAVKPPAYPFNGLPPKQTIKDPGVYSLMPKDHPLLTDYVNRYSSAEGLSWLTETMDRGSAFRAFIVDAIEERNMPPEFLFLPVIESEYRSNAVSVSGAVGLWQFMADSIYPAFMGINEWADDRRDFWKATEAALDKLFVNYRILEDWLLAVAAYNCGLTRMLSIVKEAGTTDFWELADKGYLPRETMHYVPKFLASAAVLSYPGRYGIAQSWEEGILWDRVRLDFPVDVTLLAAEAGLSPELLRNANAELNYSITPPVVPYYLKVPAEYAAAVRDVLSQDRLKLMRFYIHTIGAGDTLYDLSLHFGAGVDLILSYNPGIRPEALRIGARILVPCLKDVGPYTGRRIVQEIVLPSPTGTFKGAYIVKKGDTLWSISRQFGTSPDMLAAENRIALNGILSVGQHLNVPESRSNP